jgi:DHA2 family multidrug resistance protein
MPLVGILVARLDTRVLVSTGFITFGVCSLFWSFLTPDISPWSLTLPIIISGFSLGFVFVPLSVTTLGDLKPHEVGNGSGLYNLLRNLGGSVGISVVETILTRHQQLHQGELVRYVYAGRPVVNDAIHMAQNALTPGLGPYEAHQLGLLQVARTVLHQAAVYSYVDDFRYMALGCFCCVPMVWVFKKVKARGGAAAGAH